LRLSASASDWHPAVDEENGYAIARPRGDTHVKATLAKYEVCGTLSPTGILLCLCHSPFRELLFDLSLGD
jgi:hypothetical protein